MTEFFRTRAALVRATVASLILVGVLFAFVFPTRTWLPQRGEGRRRAERAGLLHDQTAKLEREADKLRSDREVERVARARFGLVMPGEQAWAVVPAPTTDRPPPRPRRRTTTTTAAAGLRPRCGRCSPPRRAPCPPGRAGRTR